MPTVGQQADFVDHALRRYGHALYASEEYVNRLWELAQSEVESNAFSTYPNPTLEVADRVALMVIAAAYGRDAVTEAIAKRTLENARRVV